MTWKISNIECPVLPAAPIRHQKSKMKVIDKNEKKTILLAPSWGTDNILESIGESLIDAIILKDYILIIRPHPIFFIEKKDIIKKLREKCDNINIFLENSTDDDSSFFKADIMISDYSGVAFEFAFLREKPILFIDVPKKVLNINELFSCFVNIFIFQQMRAIGNGEIR